MVNITPFTWALAPGAGQRDLLIDLGQPRSQTADGPLDRGIGGDESPLAAEMPGGVVPVLDVDELELGTLTDEQLDGSRMQGRGVAATRLARGLADQGRLGPLLEHHERMVEVDPPARSRASADQREQRDGRP